MSNFGIIRVQKFKMTDVQGIQKHNQRQGISKSNLDINYDKSNENYDLINDTNLKYEQEIKQRISERVKRKMRANSVVLSEFLVTASPEYMQSLSEEKRKEYFEKSLEFIQERYGKENTLYAVVHNDEANPHMHVGVIPITEDNRLSAKDIFNRLELQQLQNDFPKHMQKNNFNVKRGEISSPQKHLSPQEYKEKKDLEKEVNILQEKKIKELSEIKEIDSFKEPKKVLKKIKSSTKKTMFGDKVTIPNDGFKKLESLALSSAKLNMQLKAVRKFAGDEIESLKTSVQLADQRVGKLENEVKELKLENKKLDSELEQTLLDTWVLKSLLKDNEINSNVSDLERNGRIVMTMLEAGQRPKNAENCSEWLSILEDNKKAGNIPVNRLEGFIGLLKGILDKMLQQVNQFSVKALKSRNNEIDKSSAAAKRKKSRDLER